MSELNKQIEEAKEYRRKLIQKIRLNKANVDYILENGLINGSLMLDIDKAMIDYQKYSSRWRKVSEELPPMDKRVLLITIYDDNPTIGCLHNDDGELYISSESSEYELNDIMSWKPID